MKILSDFWGAAYFLKTNLATYILHNTIGTNEVTLDLFTKLAEETNVNAPSPENLKVVNELLNKQNLEIVAKRSNKLFYLFLKVTLKNENKDFYLPIQIPSIIRNNEMVYHPEVYSLYNIKNLLVNKIYEYEVMNSFSKNEEVKNLIHDTFLSKNKL